MFNNPDITTNFVKLIYPERHKNIDDDLLFTKKRARILRIPLQDDPIAQSRLATKTLESGFYYFPVLSSKNLLHYIEKINLLRLNGFYPPLEIMGYRRWDFDYSKLTFKQVHPLQIEAVKKYALYRLNEVGKGDISLIYPKEFQGL